MPVSAMIFLLRFSCITPDLKFHLTAGMKIT